jgi:hypothetical protein
VNIFTKYRHPFFFPFFFFYILALAFFFGHTFFFVVGVPSEFVSIEGYFERPSTSNNGTGIEMVVNVAIRAQPGGQIGTGDGAVLIQLPPATGVTITPANSRVRDFSLLVSLSFIMFLFIRINHQHKRDQSASEKKKLSHKQQKKKNKAGRNSLMAKNQN